MTIEQLAITVSADPASVAAARHFIGDAQRSLGTEADTEVAELLAGELVANAVELAVGEVTITIRGAAGGVRVEVRDFGYGRPEVCQPEPLDAGGGRGLMIVESLADAWGVDEFLPGKVVWFELGPAGGYPRAESSPSSVRRSTSVRRMMRDR